MTDFFKMFFGDWWHSIIGLLKIPAFEFFGYSVTLWQIILAFIVINLFVTVWWKGAKF